MSLNEAVRKIQSGVSKVHKDGKNPHTKSGYPTLEGVLDVLNPVLESNGAVVTQYPSFDKEL